MASPSYVSVMTLGRVVTRINSRIWTNYSRIGILFTKEEKSIILLMLRKSLVIVMKTRKLYDHSFDPMLQILLCSLFSYMFLFFFFVCKKGPKPSYLFLFSLYYIALLFFMLYWIVRAASAYRVCLNLLVEYNLIYQKKKKKDKCMLIFVFLLSGKSLE